VISHAGLPPPRQASPHEGRKPVNDPRPEPQQQAPWPACPHCPYRVTASPPCCCGTDPENDDQEQPSLLARLLAAGAIAALLVG
jgi:hypothetical protein